MSLRTTDLLRPLLALTLAGVLTACGNGEDTAASDDASATPATCPVTATEVPPPAGAVTDLTKKPTITPGRGPAPTELQYADIVEGDGDEAQTGDVVRLKYVGAIYETAKEFDSSWNQGPEETFNATICGTDVVPGFAVGPTGMKVGGRRQIVMPPLYGYGAAGQGEDIPPNSTLVFVVDLVEVL